MFKILKELTELPGPAGREKLVQDYLISHLSSYCENYTLDPIGNLLFKVKSKKNAPKIALVAHSDEIGFMVNSVTKDGFLHITPNYQTKQPDTRILPFHEALVLTDRYEQILGQFIIETGHHVTKEDRKKAPELSNVLVDVGLNSSEEAQSLGITIGSPVLWNPETKKLGQFVKGKAMDDRGGLALMLDTAFEDIFLEANAEIYLGATTQEELGIVGAHPIAKNNQFDKVLILEICPAYDVFSSKEDVGVVQLGKGPVILPKDGRMNYSHSLTMDLISKAEEHEIAYQRAVHAGGTDGYAFLQTGCQVALVCWPTRFAHSPGETVSLKDLFALKALLKYFLIG
ncbi:MAG: M42 family metallopeptidase [Candidatus Hodarchaeota archaeon]